jgi:hypothetical protein
MIIASQEQAYEIAKLFISASLNGHPIQQNLAKGFGHWDELEELLGRKMYPVG